MHDAWVPSPRARHCIGARIAPSIQLPAHDVRIRPGQIAFPVPACDSATDTASALPTNISIDRLIPTRLIPTCSMSVRVSGSRAAGTPPRRACAAAFPPPRGLPDGSPGLARRRRSSGAAAQLLAGRLDESLERGPGEKPCGNDVHDRTHDDFAREADGQADIRRREGLS